ncbi:MAG: efflux RND transporter periplasmic adaptor subunit [Burkholderiaceae bacterium]
MATNNLRKTVGFSRLTPAVLVLAMLSACSAGGNETDAAQKDATAQATATKNLPAISVVTAAREVIVDTVSVSGLIEPVEQIAVAPQVEGQPIDSVNADVGDTVVAGQVLATLSRESLDLQKNQLTASQEAANAGIAQAKAQIAEARSSEREAVRARDRANSLANKGVVSKASLDTARSQASAASARLNSAYQSLKSAQAQLGGVRAQMANIDYLLARTEVKAPVGGIVTSRSARVGAVATAAGGPMFELIRDGELELRADVAEQDLQRIQPGQPVSIMLTGQSGVLPGKVKLVEPTVDRLSRLGRVRIQIDESGAARAGLFAQAIIELSRNESVALPVSAVGVNSDGETALLVQDGRVKQVAIVTGARTGKKIAILQGISEGDLVVARAGAFVRDGDRINPVGIVEDAKVGDVGDAVNDTKSANAASSPVSQ